MKLTRSFEIGEHEVTIREWRSVGFESMAIAPDLDAGRSGGACLADDCPAVLLTWFDAIAYANRVSAAHVPPLPACYVLEGCVGVPGSGMKCASVKVGDDDVYACRGYRLPTEAEWEYAARGGTRTPYYSGPMTLAKSGACESDLNLDPVAWYCATPVSTNGGVAFSTRPIRLKTANAWGLFDMLGNAAEWTSDPYDGLGWRDGPLVDPDARLGMSETRTKRGGSAVSKATSTTASYRLGANWALLDAQGVRLARTLDGP